MNYSIATGTTLLGAVLISTAIASARPTVRVGVADGPQAEIIELVKKIAAHDLDLKVVAYRDGDAINRALADGRLEAATFQDGVALDADNKAHGNRLERAALTVTLPMGLYSRKVRTLNGVGRGATVAIPENRQDAARALILLHNYGLIQLRDGAGLTATLGDIVRNPRGLQFTTLRADRLAESLPKVTLAAINYREASRVGLYPARDGVGMEDARSPYAGVLTIRAKDRKEPWVTRLVAAYHSAEVKSFILRRYQDSVRRPW